MNSVLFGVHIAAGAVGIVLGPAVSWQESKQLGAGQPANSAAGAAYHAAVLVVCASAILLVVLSCPHLWFLVPVAGG
jgi:uncharacterized membrane protein YidH (DUF202 family)